jgi:hypothetical protein
VTTFFHFEWGGMDSLSVQQVWPDGDAPENPTTDDVIKALRSRGDFLERIVQDWNFDVQDIEVNGPGGHRSLARVLHYERVAAASTASQEAPNA